MDLMDKNRWGKIQDIFDKSIHLSEQDRKTYLREECGNDLEMIKEIEALINNLNPSSDFFRDIMSL